MNRVKIQQSSKNMRVYNYGQVRRHAYPANFVSKFLYSHETTIGNILCARYMTRFEFALMNRLRYYIV